MSETPKRHIVAAYDQELDTLRRTITEMAGMVELQLEEAARSLLERDPELADEVIAADKKVDACEHDINDQSVRILALRQPMANDLRLIFAAIKIAQNLERIGDYAKNVAKRGKILMNADPLAHVSGVRALAARAREVVRLAVDSFVEGDAEKAHQAWLMDETVDALHSSLFEGTIGAIEAASDPARPSVHLLFISKNLERVGDLATNMAETVHFMVTGREIEGERPKADLSTGQALETSSRT